MIYSKFGPSKNWPVSVKRGPLGALQDKFRSGRQEGVEGHSHAGEEPKSSLSKRRGTVTCDVLATPSPPPKPAPGCSLNAKERPPSPSLVRCRLVVVVVVVVGGGGGGGGGEESLWTRRGTPSKRRARFIKSAAFGPDFSMCSRV